MIDWFLPATLEVFQLYRGSNRLIDCFLSATLEVFQLYRGGNRLKISFIIKYFIC